MFPQKNGCAGDKRIEMQYTQNADVYGNGVLCSFFYTHEDEMGSTVRYSKEDGSTYEEHVCDATNRTWMVKDPIQSGLEGYVYCGANPTTNVEPAGRKALPASWVQMNML